MFYRRDVPSFPTKERDNTADILSKSAQVIFFTVTCYFGVLEIALLFYLYYFPGFWMLKFEIFGM